MLALFNILLDVIARSNTSQLFILFFQRLILQFYFCHFIELWIDTLQFSVYSFRDLVLIDKDLWSSNRGHYNMWLLHNYYSLTWWRGRAKPFFTGRNYNPLNWRRRIVQVSFAGRNSELYSLRTLLLHHIKIILMITKIKLWSLLFAWASRKKKCLSELIRKSLLWGVFLKFLEFCP